MHPDDEETTPTEDTNPITPEYLTAQIKRLRSKIADLTDDCGAYADLCSSVGNGSGTHGLQMSYDKLIEARMWTEQCVDELERRIV